MTNRIVLAVIAIWTVVAVSALIANAAPPEIESLNTLPNAGQLYLDYCAAGNHTCVTVKAICYGQCCGQDIADDIGYGCSGDIDGTVPPLFHYAGWSCNTFDGKQSFKGKATKDYDRSNCTNPR